MAAKRVVDKLVPYCARAGASRNTRYLVHDPSLQFWPRSLGSGMEQWREAASFDRADVAHLIGHRDRVPGASERSILVGVARSGFETGDLDVAPGPADILDAWR